MTKNTNRHRKSLALLNVNVFAKTLFFLINCLQTISTGEPVSAQYCPPAQPTVGSSPPPPYTDISEQQRLMEEKPETK